MSELKFKAKISRMGDRLLINIPSALSEEVKAFLDREVIVEITVKR